LTEHDECSRRDSAGEGLGDRHLANVRLDGAIERQIFGERVDEHQRVVDVRPNDRFLGSRLGKPQPALGGGLELSAKDALWKDPTKQCEHGSNLGDSDIPTRGTSRTMVRL
jgi:hypothetical protein